MTDPILTTPVSRSNLIVAAGRLASGATLVAGSASSEVVEGPDLPNALVARPPKVQLP